MQTSDFQECSEDDSYQNGTDFYSGGLHFPPEIFDIDPRTDWLIGVPVIDVIPAAFGNVRGVAPTATLGGTR